jgi:hypothetical protein
MTRVDIRQDVTHNLGRVIGVETGAIHGNVYGGDIHHVQVYALTGSGRDADWRGFLEETASPYKYLRPYTARDQALFKGRQAEIKRLVRMIGEQRQLIVCGRAGVGKTSLLAAGVIPQLMKYGALVIHLHEYTQPLEAAIREALASSADQLSVPLPDGASLPDLVRAVCGETQGTLVLVLDQFERLFQPPFDVDNRAALVKSLVRALDAVEPEYLRLFVSMREGALGQLGELDVGLPDVWCLPIPVLPLNRQQARTAIEAPLAELRYPASFVGDLVPGRLVPDLDALTPEATNEIMPAHLQIVCTELYRKACQRQPPHIDEDLYCALKGAQGIMACHVDNRLKTELAAQRSLAGQLMEAMAAPELGRWVAPDQLPRNGSSRQQVRAVLERLVKAELLVQRRVNGRREYAFTSPVVAQEVRRGAPRAMRRCYRAQADLERAWSAWLAHESLASREQLHTLEKASVHLSPAPVKILLLLRSAVARDVPDNPWPARLRATDKGRDLVCELEEPEARDLAWRTDPSTLDEARRLLGLTAPSIAPPTPPILGGTPELAADSPQDWGAGGANPAADSPQNSGARGGDPVADSLQNPGTGETNSVTDSPQDWGAGGAEPATDSLQTGGAFGPVAWTAVNHPQSATRQTAALTLTALEPSPQAALDRLRWALSAGAGGLRGWLRKSELRGVLADADPRNQTLGADLSNTDRLGVWSWRARRRLIRQRHHILWLMVGGGIGAGLALGLLRGVIGALAGRMVGIQFAMYFWWAWLLGAALCLGMALAEPLLLDHPERKGETPRLWRAPFHPNRLPALLSAGLGTLFFGLAHLVVAWFNGLDLALAPLVGIMGFVTGLGLSLALYAQPRAGWRLGLPGWLARLGGAVLIFVLTQTVFLVAADQGPGVAIAWGRGFYSAECPNCPCIDCLVLLDAALAGLALALGMTAGLILAAEWLKRWRNVVDRGGG